MSSFQVAVAAVVGVAANGLVVEDEDDVALGAGVESHGMPKSRYTTKARTARTA